MKSDGLYLKGHKTEGGGGGGGLDNVIYSIKLDTNNTNSVQVQFNGEVSVRTQF